MSSNVISQTPSRTIPARIVSLPAPVYVPRGRGLSLGCHFVGSPAPDTRKWFFNGREISSANDAAAVGSNDLEYSVDNMAEDRDGGNYTCFVENEFGSESVSYRVFVQSPPAAPVLNVGQTSPDSITLRWESLRDGNSPITETVINYKMTYGEWKSRKVGWHRTEHTLSGLNCGREYHSYVVALNALGSSPTSEVLSVRTQGQRPSGPPQNDFLVSNSSFVTLKLDAWMDHRCPIEYYVVEYKLHHEDTYNLVTNSLQPQPRYSIRGLMADTKYDVKVTAHNQAGSTSNTYLARTLAENYSGAAQYGKGGDGGRVLNGLGLRSILLIVVSSLCLLFASAGVCFCLRKSKCLTFIVTRLR